MERLTERRGEYVAIVGCKSLYGSDERKRAPASSAIARLAKYEDTGISPDEINTILAERNAAVEMLRGECYACRNNTGWHNVGKCTTCKHEIALPFLSKNATEDNWEWKGTGD